MLTVRSDSNPIIKSEDVTPTHPELEVIGVFNAGVIRYNQEIILLLRVAERPISLSDHAYISPIYDAEMNELTFLSIPSQGAPLEDARVISTKDGNFLTSISHFRVARSMDGIHFKVDELPAMSAATPYETYGIEDARITKIDDMYYIVYSAISNMGITACLASTTDFVHYTRHGLIFHPDNKDVVIFPEKINGKYYALHRPTTSQFSTPQIWIAQSSNLMEWGNHKLLLGTTKDTWEAGRIGASTVPVKVGEHWLEIYHAADADNRYCLGALLLNGEQPWIIEKKAELPIMEPMMPYELEGFFGNVVFSCGALCEDGKIKLYYGAADTTICYAEIELSLIMDLLS